MQHSKAGIMFRGFARGAPTLDSAGRLLAAAVGGGEAAKTRARFSGDAAQEKSAGNVIYNTDFHRNPIENRSSEIPYADFWGPRRTDIGVAPMEKRSTERNARAKSGCLRD